MKTAIKISLILLPALYLLLGNYFNGLIGELSLRNVDPEYVYLTNGLYLSTGDPNVSHIDNPGTPLQVIVALVCRLIYLFRSHDVPYIEDVLANSDLYLNMANHAVNLITSILLFVAGWIVMRLTSFLPYALLLQTAPFFTQITYDIIGRLAPELLMTIPVLFLTIMLIRSARDNEARFNWKTILLFGLISGFGLSIKLTYMPLLIIPFMVIPGLKDKLKFLLFTLLSLFVFAFPILFDLVAFTKWIFALFIGTGKYGGGEAGIIDPEAFSRNFRYFMEKHIFFIVVWIISSALLVSYIFMRRKTLNKKIAYGLGAILITLFLQVMMVSKHYEYRYLIPGLALFPAMVILTFEVLRDMVKFRKMNLLIMTVILAGAFIMVPRHVNAARKVGARISGEMEVRLETRYFIENLEENAIWLMTPEGYGAPMHDFSMMISSCWGGKANRIFLPVYQKLYPDTYYYFRWEGRAKYWRTDYDVSNIIATDRPVYFYIHKPTPELIDRSLSAMLPGYDVSNIKMDLIFENLQTGEKIYKLRF